MTPLDSWATLGRPTPRWFASAKFGIFIHWGAYSVPAWAEPTGALGTIPDAEWFTRNSYAEWYRNTIRIEGSAAALHHREVYRDAPYDDFLDAWRAERFDPTDWAKLFSRAGAEYVVPTSKHHDGIALWDAPGTGDRNTVHRGPRRDLLASIADAVRAQGMRFGVYYSGGLDWSVTDRFPIRTTADLDALRPTDIAYHRYASAHLRDLIAKYRPDVLWNDIDWPDAGKQVGAGGLRELLAEYYAGNPDGVVNDRWGDTHRDFTTSEYSASLENETSAVWENTRGLGWSFGYNQAEDASHTMNAPDLARHWVDIVSRGGRLLLNVGPTAAGEIPPLQRATLEAFGDWKAMYTASAAVTTRSGAPATDDRRWRRDWHTPSEVIVFLGDAGEYRIDLDGADCSRATTTDPGVTTSHRNGVLHVSVAAPRVPVAVRIPRN